MPGPGQEIPDLIMQLMRGLNKKGVRTIESPELTGYLNEAMVGIPRGIPERSGNVYPFDPNMPDPMATRPPPISRDPWFDEYLPPTMNIDEVRSLAEPSPTGTQLPPAAATAPGGGFVGDFPQFLWVVKNGKRTRIDGPFSDDLSARRAMLQMREAAGENGINLEFEIGP